MLQHQSLALIAELFILNDDEDTGRFTLKKRRDARERPMEHARYLRVQAKRCYMIARTCRDLEAASEINAVGNALRKKAAELTKAARHRRPAASPAGAMAAPALSAAEAARR